MTRFSSWRGLSRPSTSFLLNWSKGVVARVKPGHDERGESARFHWPLFESNSEELAPASVSKDEARNRRWGLMVLLAMRSIVRRRRSRASSPRGIAKAAKLERSSEVDSGSRKENASKRGARAPFRFNRNGKGSNRAWSAGVRRRASA